MDRSRNRFVRAVIVVAFVLSFAQWARAQGIPCTAQQGAAYCRAKWEERYPNSAGADACWGNTDCNNGFCNYYTMNRCGTSGNSPDAQCCAGPNVNCQNGNAFSCNDQCVPGFATCRGSDYSFGCPISLNTDVNNCGSC